MSIKWHQFMYRAKHFKLPHNEKDTVNWRDVDRETHNFPSLKYYSNIASYCSTRVFTCTRVYYITCYITYTLYHIHGISHRWYRSSADSTWNEIVTSMIIRMNGRNDFLQFIRLLTRPRMDISLKRHFYSILTWRAILWHFQIGHFVSFMHRGIYCLINAQVLARLFTLVTRFHIIIMNTFAAIHI